MKRSCDLWDDILFAASVNYDCDDYPFTAPAMKLS